MTEDGSTAPLSIEVLHEADRSDIRLAGELDNTNVSAFRSAIEPLMDSRPDRLRLDLAGVTFIDSSGLGFLLHLAKGVGTLTLVNPSAFVRRKISLLGLGGILAIEP